MSDSGKAKYSKEWLDFMNENILTADKINTETFYLEEFDQLNRLIDYMNNTKEEPNIYNDFRLYIAQCDARRNNDFIDIFPELNYLMEDDYYGK